jgi:formylglycine-generating enzyme required for sulfatase activity
MNSNSIISHVWQKIIAGATAVALALLWSCTVECLPDEVLDNSSIRIETVFVPGGTFTMGKSSGGNENERPAHQVTLNGFNMGRYPVTQAQWVAVMGSNPSGFKNGDQPVEMVSWNDIAGTGGATMIINGITYHENGFIYRLNQLTGNQYRLPTEAEWEFAARGGSNGNGYAYSGSSTIDNVAWYGSNSTGKPQPVGTKQPNGLNIYDMSGNVAEWCSDWYAAYTATEKTSPAGASSGTHHVLRGGSWVSAVDECSVTARDGGTPDLRNSETGFRIVRHQ